MPDRNVPWPVWAVVTLAAAAITGYFAQSGVAPKPVEAPEPSPPANVVVHNRLAPNQVSERVTLVVDGRIAGTLELNQQRPQGDIPLNLPSAGKYSYTAEAQAWFVNAYGQMMQGFGTGQGSIDVASGRHFNLVGSWSGNTWLISLVEEGQ